MNHLNPRAFSSLFHLPHSTKRFSKHKKKMSDQSSSSENPKSKSKTETMSDSSPEKKNKDETPTNSYKMFKFFNRKFKINELSPPSDVKETFSKFSAGADLMSPDQFRTFLIEHQAEKPDKVSLGDAKRILRESALRRQNVMKDKKDEKQKKEKKTSPHEDGLTVDDFFNFLFEEEFNGPFKREVHHDMTAPLSHYFIYTGHNSYLTGNQLNSDCSDVPIIKALERGVKVIELDLWPTSSKNDIQVYHGRTLTAPVTLPKCLKSIKEHAFVKSPYPVVITFEDHLTTKLRVKVAEMVTQIFGDILYYPKPDDPMTEFPSPEDLKYRIIISTKPPKVGEGNDKNSSEESESESDKEAEKTEKAESKTAVDIKPVRPEAPEYTELITIHAGKPQGGLKDALENGEKVRRLSLSEQKLEKAAEDYGSEIVRFTQRNILRIYPKGTRITSSNYKPHVGWMHGAQMVAFNMQGRDKLLWLMHGMFRANGGCGYLKRPGFLMHKGPNDEVFDPRRSLIAAKTLKVKLYVGTGWHLDFSQTHFDRFSPPDFYTKVYIVGVPADCAKHKTEIIDDEWIPVWDQEFTFGLTVPELAILRIEVREYDRSDKDDFGGQTCLPVSELKIGFRSVPLYNKKGEKYRSVRILMRFQFESNLQPS